jgi:hypothetical protein
MVCSAKQMLNTKQAEVNYVFDTTSSSFLGGVSQSGITFRFLQALLILPQVCGTDLSPVDHLRMCSSLPDVLPAGLNIDKGLFTLHCLRQENLLT